MTTCLILLLDGQLAKSAKFALVAVPTAWADGPGRSDQRASPPAPAAAVEINRRRVAVWCRARCISSSQPGCTFPGGLFLSTSTPAQSLGNGNETDNNLAPPYEPLMKT